MRSSMTCLCASTPENLRVIVCVAFDRRASPDEIASFKSAVVACPLILHSVELTGAFDFMVEAGVPDVRSFDERMKSIAKPMAKLVSRFEASFVCRRYVRKDDARQSMWVSCEHGTKRIDVHLIDKISAEGDYMRVHSNGASWLIHSTMRSIVERLSKKDFGQIHRSTVVRYDFIERIVLDSGRWFARLNDGTRERVAKGQVNDIFEAIRVVPSKLRAVSPNATAAIADKV